MRYLIISDIHANLEALDATMGAAGPHDHVLVLGDLVGYGADPGAVVARVRALPSFTCIRGNHDKVAAGLEGFETFNSLARQAIVWTADALAADARSWIAALPQGPVIVDDLVEICHGSPFDEDLYIFDDLDATRSLREQRRQLCLFGHTHVPAAYRLSDRLEHVAPMRSREFDIALGDQSRCLVNCGAVGQPRDGDPRAAYGILDTDARTLSVRRVSYDVAAAQAKIIAAGLPDLLAHRLGVGR